MSEPTDPTSPGSGDTPPPEPPSEQPGTTGSAGDADTAPSEFLTPVRAYDTIEPEPGATWPGSAAHPATAPPRRRGTAIGAAVVAVVLVAAALVWVVSDRSSSGPLEAPADLTATAEACAAPDCERQQAIVTLRWSQADDGVDVVEIIRSGGVLEVVEPDVTSHEIVGLRLDHPYVFGVRAVRAGEPGPASTVEVHTPVPPLREAQLAGTYRVRERVRSATNLSSVEEIANPRPGSTAVNTWTFAALCDDQAGACPTKWFTWGPLQDRGRGYEGTFRSEPARCAGGGLAATTTQMHLVVLSGRAIQGRWRVDRFRGTMRIDFACPGDRRSMGVLQVDGRARG
jgi:hypothetical protein